MRVLVRVMSLAHVLVGVLVGRVKRDDRGEGPAVAVLLLALLAVSCVVAILLVAKSWAVVDKVCANADPQC